MRRGLVALKGRLGFGGCLALIVFGALAVRCGYIAGAKSGACPERVGQFVVAVVHSDCLGGNGFVNDQFWYSTTADEVSHGHFFSNGPRSDTPTAAHPPLTVLVLAGTSFAFEHLPLSMLSEKPRTTFDVRFEIHVREQRYTMALIGTLVVLLIGLLGRRIGGDGVGLVAALIAAIYPNMWVNDGLLFAEPVARLCVLAALLVALRCRTRASTLAVFGLGVLCGLAALTRSELLLLLPLLAIPLAWRLRSTGIRPVLVVLCAAAAGTAVIVGPWVVFNATRFKDPVFIATNDGLTLSGSNCNPSYYGSTIGLWSQTGCDYSTAELAKLGDESQVSHTYRTKAVAYIRAHLSRVPVVVAARVARTWGLYRPVDMVSYEVNEDKERWVSWAGLLSYYPVFFAAIAGAVILYRRRVRHALWILCIPLLTTTIIVALTSGQVRHRAVAEPSLTILAAVTVCAALDRRNLAR
jgi:4-amino-4-deoxy-L-arabinose transferase-like glycosyltransferase